MVFFNFCFFGLWCGFVVEVGVCFGGSVIVLVVRMFVYVGDLI